MTKQEMTPLHTYGWNEHWSLMAEQMPKQDKELVPARVTAQFSKQYRIITQEGEQTAVVTGKYEYEAGSKSDFPAVGDWVLVEPLQGESRAVIHKLLPRKSAVTRREAGSVPDEQVIAANMDTVFIINALNKDFNVRRIERYLIAVWESGAAPVILLTKADLCESPETYVSLVEEVALGVPVFVVSSLKDQGKEQLQDYLVQGKTVAITGTSGAGKSTLLNWLSGQEMQRVQGIREEDARGRHTTTHRELFVLPGGAIMVDTPGMRELQLWDSEEGFETAFADISTLAQQCRFHDCRHETEAGCAVREALQDGTLDAKRYANYKKTERELAHIARKERASTRRQNKSSGKSSRKSGRVHRGAYQQLLNDEEL
ncbi:ribosome small subunit-dependent GTPase A [Paenibacillus glucanolyticus]|uniref:ribosome small subunit-dependent GTPase A n=1 Tax=Paenibacillus glucanolyticus TaxID=59843 RepID=UPI00096E8B61|nr:ribosome small subunit-dependent GTPase A [Paenibacillus glucanolyticus]OMF81664.1 ribosome small subunit-dependent GTPase A [Paenibacillus glucanolyticus]